MKCAVITCRNNTLKRPVGISFHRFPKDEGRRKLWLEAIRRPGLEVKQNTCVCSEHFLERDLTSDFMKIRLCHDAIPELKIPILEIPVLKNRLPSSPNTVAPEEVPLNEEVEQDVHPVQDVAPSNASEENMPAKVPGTVLRNITNSSEVVETAKPDKNLCCSEDEPEYLSVVVETAKPDKYLCSTEENPETTMELSELCSEDGKDTNMEKIRLICRMCLQCTDLVNIFSESVKNSGLWKMINVHLGQDVSKDDDMPEFICLLCIKTICEFDIYCIRAAKNQDYLRKICNTKIKPADNSATIEIQDEASQNTLIVIVPSRSPSPERYKEPDLEESNETQTNDANSEPPEETVATKTPIMPEPFLNMAPIWFMDEVTFPMDDIGVDMDYIAENLEPKELPDSIEQDLNDTTDDDDVPYMETVVCAGENVNEIFHDYCSADTEPVDLNSNIPEHVKPLINNYPKILMKDGRMLVRTWRLHDMLDKFYILKCDMCSEEEASKYQHQTIKELLMHYKKCHGTEGYIMCCDKKLRNRSEFTFHMIWHVQPSAFRCSICGRKVSKPTSLVAHMKSHEGKEEYQDNEIRCKECGVRVKSQHFLEIHKLKVHQDNEKELLDITDISEPHPNYPGFPKSIMKNGEVVIRGERLTELLNKFYTFSCDMCTEFKTFPNFRALLEHYQIVHSTKGYAMCCGSKFKIRMTLIYHMARHLDPDAFKCQYCGKVIEKLGQLKDHMMVHKSEEERVYFCSQCPRRYTTKTGLERHMISHIPKDQRKKHPCAVCGKMFDHRSSLRNHLRATHSNQEYVCHVCGKVFKNEFVYKTHSKSHDPNYVSYKQRTNYRPPALRNKLGAGFLRRRRERANRICPYCSIEFPKKKDVIEHVDQEHDCLHKCPHCHYSNTKYVSYLRHVAEKHVLDRKYVCKICGAHFEYGCKLNYHMNGHTREIIYPCQFCGKEYISMSGLCKHERECHSEEYRQLKHKKRRIRKLRKEPVEEEYEENPIIVDAIAHLDFSTFLSPDE